MTVELTRAVPVGTLSLASSGAAAYAPPSDWSGTTSFAYRASDGFAYSGSVNVTVTVTPVNDAPVAAGDTYGTIAGGRLTVRAPSGVLGNDTDVDSSVLSAALVAPPKHGRLTLGADGAFTYIPATGFSGSDSFSYAAYDGALASAPVLVTIRVAALRASASAAGLAEGAAITAEEPTSTGLPTERATAPDEETAPPADRVPAGAGEDDTTGRAWYFTCGVALAVLLTLLLGLWLALKRRKERSGDGPDGVSAEDAGTPEL